MAGVGVLDTGLRYLYVNPALERINGIPAAEHLGRTVSEVLPGLDAREDMIRAVLADGKPREITISGFTARDATVRRYWHGAFHRLESGGGSWAWPGSCWRSWPRTRSSARWSRPGGI